MYKFIAALLAFCALLAVVRAQTDLTEFISAVLSERQELVSAVVSEVNAVTTFTGEFSSYSSDLSVLVESILSSEFVTTSVETTVETETATVTTSSSAAAERTTSMVTILAVFLASLAVFYAF